MDRGVKVAIFVASVLSLALGLIWDQVLKNARVAAKTEVSDEMGPEVKEGKIGSPDLKRLVVLTDNGPAPAVLIEEAAAPEQPKKTDDDQWDTYIVRKNDSWALIAEKRFKDRGLRWEEIKKVNPTIKMLHPGQKIRIPPGRKKKKPK